MFQHFALYPHLSALNNITLGLRHGLGLSKARKHTRAPTTSPSGSQSETCCRGCPGRCQAVNVSGSR
ncbi:hypothetical protein MLGJGCBP_06746 [Rhodococcus sp. T7]|nr:hypothetical protein MLGJGCBP_09840 [Rhodococcus sp. T7]KAF0960167.1 hypothetical protein MLGJGCBP_06746 [Rhodococcus sp. T7]